MRKFDDCLVLQVVLVIILSVWCLSKNYEKRLSLPEHFHKLSWHFISIRGVDEHTVSINMFLASTLSPRSFWLHPPLILVFRFLPLPAMQSMPGTRSLKVRTAREKKLEGKECQYNFKNCTLNARLRDKAGISHRSQVKTAPQC